MFLSGILTPAEFYLQIIGKYENQYKLSCENLIKSRDILLNDLRHIPYLEPYESQANYIFCKVIGKKSVQLATDLCNHYSILIKDCTGKAGIIDQYIRVAVRDTRDNETLINSLSSLV